MFPDYEPPEELKQALSQAAILAADIDPETRYVHVAAHAEHYIPRRLTDKAAREIARLYGLRALEITITHPASELNRLEPEELMQMFVSEQQRFAVGAAEAIIIPKQVIIRCCVPAA